MSLLRPDPMPVSRTTRVDADAPVDDAVRHILDGHAVCVTDRWSTAVTLQSALHSALGPVDADVDHPEKRAFRRRLRAASDRLRAPVEAGRITLGRAPSIGLLGELYPEPGRITVPVLDLQRMDKADEVHRHGVHMAVLGQKLHPFWGTYVPSRTSHLELFGTWLSAYEGGKERAVDVGTGSGVLALMLSRAGFSDVVATDDNPNAIHSLQQELTRQPRAVRPIGGDLLAEEPGPFDVIVFNPPWLRGDVDELLDRALYYDDPALFERFFDQALQVLAPEGRIVLVWSDIGSLVQPDEPHPIEVELGRGRLRLAQKLRRKVKGTLQDGRRRRTKERVEVWELARA